MTYSDGVPMFCGDLDQKKILWLLDRDDVDFIENDGDAHIVTKKDLPKGVKVDGVIKPAKGIKDGTIQLPRGSYIVGVKAGKKDSLLKEMKKKLDFTPAYRYSKYMPLFAGDLDQDKIVWLLNREEVDFIEKEGAVHIASMDAGSHQKSSGGMHIF